MDRDRRHGGCIEDQGRDAGAELRILGVADPQARNVGDEVARRQCGTPQSLRLKTTRWMWRRSWWTVAQNGPVPKACAYSAR